MKRAMKIGLLIELRHPKNSIALFLVIVAMIAAMFYTKSQMAGNQIAEGTKEFYAIQSALTKFQLMDASEAGDGSPIYKNLHKQKTAIALQVANLKMSKDKQFYKTSYRLALARQDMYELEGYEKVRKNMPSKLQNDMNLVYYKYLVDTDAKIYNDTLQYWAFLLFVFSMISAVWYLFISFYTSNILLDDYEHATVVRGYPIAFSTYMLSKCMTVFLYIVGFIALIFIVALPLYVQVGSGDIEFPVVFYNGEVKLLMTWQFIAMIIGFMMLTAIFGMLFSIILNVLLKNMYLTLFVQGACFFLPIIFPRLIEWFPFNPFHYVHFNFILNGGPFALSPPVDVTMTDGVWIILIAIVLMLFIIKQFFSVGKIRRV